MSTRLKDVIESLIFVSLEPLTLEKIKNICSEFAEMEIKEAIQEIIENYASNQRGIQIIQAAGGYLFSTKSEHDQWVRRLLRMEQKNKLSRAALETLATVAYHQPMTLAEISALRGVDSTYTLKTLLQKKLVKITGRKKSPGRPLIYRTTDRFLTYFGLNSLSDLPSEEEISKILDEEKIFE
ncbi:MAG: SMC-Scp complex subunit ScpB [Candidatus Aminicenantes bacterium]|nr:SMC-Scp complex subunit ScpB [Candidatus Aminicenantes bacterium]MDH5383092.1 SMC-Scp complex subunit ScpB [Candidatus Aminicenantes bacterium]MDH5742283.1 SMC-Scp complex subunit ScpB [Candidatus Aminicenantes bacterium]